MRPTRSGATPTAWRPDPRLTDGKWTVDLRGAGFGNKYTLGYEPDMDRDGAIWATSDLLAQLRGERMAEPEKELFTDGAPKTIGGVIDVFMKEHETRTVGGRQWFEKYAKTLKREIGHYAVSDFAPPGGSARLRGYVRELKAKGLGGRTVANRVCVARQVFRFAVREQWLAQEPVKPDNMPMKAPPVFRWISEGMFRQLRAAIYTGPVAGRQTHKCSDDKKCMKAGGTCARRKNETAEPLEIQHARRRVYLSWLFYTGVHKADADTLNPADFFLHAQRYIRRNTKTRRQPEQFQMPEQLYADLVELQELLGREFRPGELIAGGYWKAPGIILNRAAKLLGFPHGASPAVLRRSFARELFQQGFTPQQVASRMGHVDERMIRAVYAETFAQSGDEGGTRWRKLPPEKLPRTPSGMARVLSLAEDDDRRLPPVKAGRVSAVKKPAGRKGVR